MNIILFNKNELIDNSAITISLTDRRAEHIIKVLKTKCNETVKIGIINGAVGTGKLIELTDQTMALTVDTLNSAPPNPIPVTLILAMQRPKTMKKILQSATAMGVKVFHIIETWKVEKSYWSSPLLKESELTKQLQLGLEQAGDTVMPQIIVNRRFKPFVEDDLPEILRKSNSCGFIAHPYAENECPHKLQKPATIAIGPEGGFTDYEIIKMSNSGMLPVNIGSRPLRSEFAVTAILAKLI